MQEEEKKKSKFKLILKELRVLLNFVQLILAAAITVHIASSKPMMELTSWLETEYPIPKALAYSNYGKHSDFAFGPQAVISCMNKCNKLNNSNNKEVCKRHCYKFSLEEFARRIRLAENSPEADLENISNVCKKDRKFPVNITLGLWLEKAKYINNFIQNSPKDTNHFAKLRTSYERNLSLMDKITTAKNFPETTFLAKQLYQTSCLEAHKTLSNMGELLSKQHEDYYSQKYYENLSSLLGNTIKSNANEIESQLNIISLTEDTNEK